MQLSMFEWAVVQCLLGLECSINYIHDRTRISRQVIRGVRDGQTPTFFGLTEEPLSKAKTKKSGTPAYVRCDDCGGLVIPPCRACATRRSMGCEPRLTAREDHLRLQLHPDERRVYDGLAGF